MATLRELRRSVSIVAGALALFSAHAFAQSSTERKSYLLRGKEQIIFPREKLVARGLTPPEIPDDQNAAWVYVDAINAFVDLPDDLQQAQDAVMASGKWPDGDTGERLAEWLDKNADAIARTRKAGSMPQYYMPLVCDGEHDAIIAALLPTMGPMRNLARLMTLSAVRERVSNPDAAVDDAIATHQLAHHAAQGSTLIEGLVGTAIAGLAEKSLRWSIEDGTLSAERLALVSAEFNKLAETQPDWERMARSEEKLSEGHIDDMLDSTASLPGLLNPNAAFGNKIEASPDGWQHLARRLKRVYLPDRLMKKHNRSFYERMVAAARDEERSGNPRMNDEEFLADIPVWNVVGRILLPSLSRSYEITTLRRANFERTRVAVAVAAYKKSRGQYPTKLADLSPAFISAVPKDPLTGQDIDYAPAADGKSHTGLEPIDGDRAKAYYERRKARSDARRAEATHPWRLLVKEYTDRYQFDEAQRTAADAMVRELDARAAAYAKSLAADQKADPVFEQGLTTELTRRLNDLPTAAQRAAAKK